MKRILVIFLSLAMIAALGACGQGKGKAEEAAATLPPSPPELGITYTSAYAQTDDFVPVAQIWIPVEWVYDMNVYSVEEEGKPPYALVELTYEDNRIEVMRMRSSDYEAVGVLMPESLEEFSRQDYVRAALRDDEEFSLDVYGNLCVVRAYEEDGVERLWYYCVKETTNAFGVFTVDMPADAEAAAGGDGPYILAYSALLCDCEA